MKPKEEALKEYMIGRNDSYSLRKDGFRAGWDAAENQYKDLLRRYAMHVGEFAEKTYTEPELSFNHITKEEAEFINELINEPKILQQ